MQLYKKNQPQIEWQIPRCFHTKKMLNILAMRGMKSAKETAYISSLNSQCHKFMDVTRVKIVVSLLQYQDLSESGLAKSGDEAPKLNS